VTAPRPAPDTDLTERLAHVLAARLGCHGVVVRSGPARDAALALLPVVQRYADERAAEALEAAAQSAEDAAFRSTARAFGGAPFPALVTAAELRVRAAALRTDTDRSKP
jgi:hypothetical protein